jgi:thiol-disulfide isomerase/thioredoxin
MIMRFLLPALTLTLLSPLSGAVSEKTLSEGAALEKEVGDIVSGSQVTVVHFWAPWCSNCKEEMRPDGWAKFVNENPAVKVVFINVWHGRQDPAPKLAAAELGAQENFLARTHPNETAGGEKVDKFLGQPLQWVPTTWVYRDGKLRYALNYGEIRFEMLQQMVKDAARNW